ncbi:NAT_SF domain containing protein [uncultured Caudovirales phage]|uniref:NAT_SF domain containing protein n=1 Tax=uncultured Caudovirales phage TaxID=2100421 RepID=A0A6J5RE51_9CAUD|nr:NAT_SF domain containing protein [uncultured Caudovirales phage]
MIRISSAVESDGRDIMRMFATEKDIWPSGVKQPWYWFWKYPKRSERWDKLELDGKIVGSIHWHMDRTGTRTVYDMIVHPDHRRRGLGRALLAHVGAPMELKTTHSHEFYQALGFIRGDTKAGKTSYILELGDIIVPAGPWIMTYSGKMVNPLALRHKDICIEDIAHHLACINRFAGAAATPLSVAQHSVYVSKLVSVPHKLQALLHDASEAYLGDIPKWVKAASTFDGYRDIEEYTMKTILERFECEVELHEEVKRADRVMVMHEAPNAFGKLWPNHLDSMVGYEPITPAEKEAIGKWVPQPWRVAEEQFMIHFRKYTK